MTKEKEIFSDILELGEWGLGRDGSIPCAKRKNNKTFGNKRTRAYNIKGFKGFGRCKKTCIKYEEGRRGVP